MRSIPTVYNGVSMRSRLEAKTAQTLSNDKYQQAYNKGDIGVLLGEQCS